MKQNITTGKKRLLRKEKILKRKPAPQSDFCRSLLIDACGCRDDSRGYFDPDGSMCYDASCGCINFR